MNLKKLGFILLPIIILVIISKIILGRLDLDHYQKAINHFAEPFDLKVDIEGKIATSIIPTLGVEIDGPIKVYRLSAPSNKMLEVANITIAAKLWPLLWGKFEITAVQLKKPQLIWDNNFQKFYDKTISHSKAVKTPNQLPTPDSQTNKAAQETAKENIASESTPYKFIDLTIIGGEVQYNKGKDLWSIANLDAKLIPTGTSNIKFDLTQNKQTITIALELLNSLKDLLKGNSKLNLTLKLPKKTIKMQTEIKNSKENAVIEIKANELIKNGTFTYIKNSNSLNGNLNFAALKLPEDVNFLDSKQSNSTSEKIWSTNPINLDWLKKFNGNITFTAPSINFAAKDITNIAGQINLKKASLNAKITQAKIANGSLMAQVKITSPNKYAGNISLNKLDLSDLQGFKALTGILDGKGEWYSSGNNVKQLINNLTGKGNLLIGSGKLSKLAFFSQKLLSLTGLNFTKATGSFEIANGIITNRDFILVGPLIELRGEGNVNLPEYTIDYLINPTELPANLDLLGLAIEVTGSLNNPQAKPSPKKLLYNTINNVGKKLNPLNTPINKGLRQIIENIF